MGSDNSTDASKPQRQILGVGNSAVVVSALGRPRTKGSMIPVHSTAGPGKCKVTLKESGKYSVAWKNAMIRAIRQQCEITRIVQPVRVDAFFTFARLCLPDQSMLWPTREKGEFAHGDEDKLRRNVLDALTQSGLIADDALVVGGQTWKRWVEYDESIVGDQEGVLIVVSLAPSSMDVRAMEQEALRAAGLPSVAFRRERS